MSARFGLALVFVTVVASTTGAAPFVPTSLSPGDVYHLAFVTSGGRDAASTAIADYNSFVNAQAMNNPGLTGTNMGVVYSVIGSTSTVDAIVNAPVSGPVYNFNDELIALNSGDLWDSALQNAILYDESAQPRPFEVWTGTDVNGLGVAGRELGTLGPIAGDSSQAGPFWINWNQINPPAAAQFSFYGLSQPLTVPANLNVPEPSSLICWLLLGSLGAWLSRSTPHGSCD